MPRGGLNLNWNSICSILSKCRFSILLSRVKKNIMECYYHARCWRCMHEERYGVPIYRYHDPMYRNPLYYVARSLCIQLTRKPTMIVVRGLGRQDRHYLDAALTALCTRETLRNERGNAKSAEFLPYTYWIGRLEWGSKRVGQYDEHKFFIRRDGGKGFKNPFSSDATSKCIVYYFEDFLPL